jgi:hypothetical protein
MSVASRWWWWRASRGLMPCVMNCYYLPSRTLRILFFWAVKLAV